MLPPANARALAMPRLRRTATTKTTAMRESRTAIVCLLGVVQMVTQVVRRARVYLSRRPAQTPSVRCPGHTIQYMGFRYDRYVERVLELAGLSRKLKMEEYGTWTPY